MGIEINLKIIFLIILFIIIQSCQKKSNEQSEELENNVDKAGNEVIETDSESIKIAVIFAKSGPADLSERQMFQAASFAFEEINNLGGILGKKIEVIEIDNMSSSIGAKLAAEQAVSINVTAVIGCGRSSDSIAAGNILQEAKIIMISPVSTNPDVTLLGDYIFRVCFADNLQGRIMANFAINDLYMHNAVVLINKTYIYSSELSEYFINRFKELGGEILWEGHFIENMSDFSSILTKVKELEPEIIYLPAYPRDSGYIIRQARGMGILSIFLGGDGWGSDGFFTYGKDSIEGSYLTDHWYYDLDEESSRNFVSKFIEKFNEIPDSGAALTYDAVYILADALIRANSLDTTKIRNFLAKTENFNGITGSITFDENGDPIKPAVIMKIENNERVFIKTIEP